MIRIESDAFQKALKNTDKELVVRNMTHGQEYKILGLNVYEEDGKMVLWIEEIPEDEEE